MDTGPCRALITRYGYDTERKACVKFTYGGCGGNSNNYATLGECIESCEWPIQDMYDARL